MGDQKIGGNLPPDSRTDISAAESANALICGIFQDCWKQIHVVLNSGIPALAGRPA